MNIVALQLCNLLCSYMEECYLNFTSMTWYHQYESDEIRCIFLCTFLIQKYKNNSLLRVKDTVISTLSYSKYFIPFILQNSFVYI